MTAMYWTTTEIQVLLEVTLQYKEEKSRQNIDWRSHTGTYHDIWKTFLQVYPVKRAEEGVLHFPHDVERINKAKVIFKLVDMRRKFHKQLDTRNIYSGFWDICEKIWGEKEPCDVPAVEQAPVEEQEEDDEEEEVEGDSEDTCSALESESTGADWSSTESEDETETFKPPCKRRLFEDETYYTQLDRLSREIEERSRLHEERMEKQQDKLLDLLLRYVKKSVRYNEHQRYGLLDHMVLLKTWSSSGTGPYEDMVPMHSELGQQSHGEA